MHASYFSGLSIDFSLKKKVRSQKNSPRHIFACMYCTLYYLLYVLHLKLDSIFIIHSKDKNILDCSSIVISQMGIYIMDKNVCIDTIR